MFGGEESKEFSKVSNPRYVKIIGNRIDEVGEAARKEGNVNQLIDLANACIAIGDLEKAGVYAYDVLEKRMDEGLRIYQKLERVREQAGKK